MVNVKQPYADSFGSYAQSVTVIQKELPDYVVKSIFQKEIYADGTGLVYKENIILKYKQYEVGEPGWDDEKKVVENGIQYYQYLIDYEEK